MRKTWILLRSLCTVGAALLVSLAMEAALAPSVDASAAPPPLSVSPGGHLSDGQTVSVAVGPNGYFTPHTRVNILECADPGGSGANLPKDITTCDGNTVQGSTIQVANDGSFSDSAYQVYLLPSSALGEQANFEPACNEANPCVLYVGQDQNDFTAPKVFSAPFLISQGSGTSATTTTTTTTTGATSGNQSSGSTSANGTRATSSAASFGAPTTSATSASGSLANTGPSGLTWLTASGVLLLLIGATGRRLALRSIR